MGRPTSVTVVEVEGGRLMAACVSRGGGAGELRVRGVLDEAMPEGVSRLSAEEVGRWVGRRLKRAKLGGAGVVVSVPRSEVVLKTLGFAAGPKGRGPSDADMPAMVRLQLSRQVTMPAESAVMDFVRLQRGPVAVEGVEGAGVGVGMVGVLAGALSVERVAWYRKMAATARVRLMGLQLRSAGTARCAGGVSSRAVGPVMCVDAGPTSAEYAIVEGGDLVYVRSVALALPGEGEGESGVTEYCRRVAVEAKRTWMSFRATSSAGDLDGVVVLGRGGVSDQVTRRAAESLDLGVRQVELDGLASSEVEASAGVLPLVGLGARVLEGVAGLDFANAHRAPDPTAGLRAVGLGSALVMVLVVGGGWALTAGRLGEAERRRAAATERRTEAAGAYEALVREHARAGAARAWISAGAGWGAELMPVMSALPEPEDARLDRFEARVEPVVSFRAKSRDYPGTWSGGRAVRVELEGEADDVGLTLAVRQRLLSASPFALDAERPDDGLEFSFSLRSSRVLTEAELMGVADGAAGGREGGEQ